MKKIMILCLLYIAPISAIQADESAEHKVENILNTLHQAASDANWETYFALFSENVTYMGTDVSERWDKATFQGYASGSKGWTYKLRERHIDVAPNGESAWFDEVLDSEKYGTSRGTGVLIRSDSGWKIVQYHLTFPIPNDLANGFTEQIQAFEAKQKNTQQ